MKSLIILVSFLSIVSSQNETIFVLNRCFCVTKGYCHLNGGDNTTSPPFTTPAGTVVTSTRTSTTSSGTTRTDSNSVTTPETVTEPDETADSSTASTPDVTPESTGTTKRSNRSDIEASDGSLDLRISVSGLQYNASGNTVNQNIGPASVGVNNGGVNNQTSCAAGLELCCPKNGYGCGIRYPPVASAPSPSSIGQSYYGAHPWAVDIRLPTNDFLGAGALIHVRHVLTVAHKVYYHDSVKCRFGVWNRRNDSSIFPIQEQTVPQENIFVHQNFTSMRTLHNNIAILRLLEGLELGSHPVISPICLANQPIQPQRCWVAGWGKGEATKSESYQMILREVSVPIVTPATCESNLKKTKLGVNFTLHSSFMCAGGEAGNDACIGDGGAALACSVNGRFYIAGLVAWGIGCGTANVPGVYVNVQNYISWIQTSIKAMAERERKVTATTPKPKSPANSSVKAQRTTTRRKSTTKK